MADLKEMEVKGRLIVSKVEQRQIDMARSYIWRNNLCCSDAIHVSTYFDVKGDYFVVEVGTSNAFLRLRD